MPTSDGSDDAVGVSGPGEGLGVLVGLIDEAVDGSLQVDEGVEDAAFETSSAELGEEALDGVEPGARGRREVEDEARMPIEPRPWAFADARN